LSTGRRIQPRHKTETETEANNSLPERV